MTVGVLALMGLAATVVMASRAHRSGLLEIHGLLRGLFVLTAGGFGAVFLADVVL